MIFRYLSILALFLVSLTSCSREDPIKENSNLRNNHSVVFGFLSVPEDTQAFIDSIVALDKVITFDTLTVTVHDSIYFMGFLRYNSDKVFRYVWDMGDKDSLIQSANATLHSYAYDSAGIYSPLFIAVDGASARDTAGRNQFVRVIDTPPFLSLLDDTLWTRAEKNAVLKMLASDSFGRITKLTLDWNADGKVDSTITPIIDSLDLDTLRVTVHYKSSRIDSLNNQKVIVAVTDDDQNTTKDTMVVHFNKRPSISLLQPSNEMRVSKYERRFAFYYKGDDDDNPSALRYVIRVGKSPDNSGTAPILTDGNMVAGPLKEKSWEAISDSALWNMSDSLTGRLYWQVWVTDGYDTATSETWTFFLGDLSETKGYFNGYVKFEGRTAHDGIRIVFVDSDTNLVYTKTNTKGYYQAAVAPGYYNMYAIDTTGFGFHSAVLKHKYVEMGDVVTLESLELQDPAPPVISLDAVADTLNSRSVTLSGALSDSGSQVKLARAWLDDTLKTVSTLKVNSWIMNLTNMSDGRHTYKMVVADSAGLISDTLKVNFFVKATTMSLLVNNQPTIMVNAVTPLVFTATLNNANPPVDAIVWTYTVGTTHYTKKTAVVSTVATLTLEKADLPQVADGVFYEMTATTSNGALSAKARFGFIGNDPVAYFVYPTLETVVTINDTVDFQVNAQAGALATDPTAYTLSWQCAGTLAIGRPCPGDTNATVLAWTNIGTKQVVVNVVDDASGTASDTITVTVISDPPTVNIKSSADTIRQKINSSLSFSVTASDKYGTVNSIVWGCSNGNVLAFDSSKVFSSAASIATTIGVTLPGMETNTYKCVVKAIDDDNESSLDTLFFRVVLDKPSVTVNTKQSTVKINSEVNFSATATDTLGTIEKYYVACDSNLSKIDTSFAGSQWNQISKPDTTVTMPSSACTWRCIMGVVDDDGLRARDTGTFTVVLDPPTVSVSEDTLTTSIKDTVILDAMASDVMGSIALYEWSCGPAGTAGNNFAWSSDVTPRYPAIMPSVARNNYLCIIRVTDDDGQTDLDTTHITVLLDPPTITVALDSITSRSGINIALNATASDAMGSISKREWSCGTASEIAANWKTVSQYDTVWKSPTSTPAGYLCVARATDDDGNTVQDTTKVGFSTKLPIITVTNELVYVKAGDYVDVDAVTNDAWAGIKKYRWNCGTEGSAALSDTSVWWTYNSSFAFTVDSATTAPAKDLLCIVRAVEDGTGYVASDTLSVMILKVLPIGVITTPDTTYIWSGDETVSAEGKYFYSEFYNGSASTIGTLGNINHSEYWWNFSNYDANSWYEGESNGSLDTNIAEFNEAFIRLSGKGSITIKLDYRDSSTTETDASYLSAFYYRHRAATVQKRLYFRKAWENISAPAASGDTVIVTSTAEIAPAIISHNNKITIAYVNSSGSIVTAYSNGTTWTTFGTAIANVAGSIQFASGASGILYLCYIDNDGVGHVLKSSNGTSAWTELDSGFGTELTSLKVKVNPNTDLPSVIWIGTVSSTVGSPRIQDWKGTAWGTAFNATRDSWQAREADMAFDANGNRLTCITRYTSGDYAMYYYYFASGATSTTSGGNYSAGNGEFLQLFFANNQFYLGFRSRDNSGYPQLFTATNSASRLKASGAWTTNAAVNKPFGRMSYSVNFAIGLDGNPIATFDDALYAKNSQIHTYRFDGAVWHLLGENELPYFKNYFVLAKGYYLRGARPNLAVSSTGEIYLSMRALEAVSSATSTGRGVNNGPLVMKYLADNW